ncbi:MAG TPA: right-handed parallel beta-helix repeat-containing protein, partial [Candidatus Krumholzibacteria bacterium]|nr:right-handed parallel beta-helix repeat-containing protein [Candidatus Krumholzibacteria bacterium]
VDDQAKDMLRYPKQSADSSDLPGRSSMTLRILLLAASAGLLFVGTAPARTWYVAADGSGDAPTIDAAVDSSSAGDVILVGPGTHDVGSDAGGVFLKVGTSLISEAGPVVTIVQPATGIGQSDVLKVPDACVITGFTIRRAWLATIYAYGNNVEISGNIIEISGGGLGIRVDRVASVHHNVIYGGGDAIVVEFSEGITEINNNIILGRVSKCGGTVLVYCNDVTTASSCVSYGQTNFNLDPIFCGIGNYYLNAASPCAPGNHPNGFDNCGLIGPLPVGCGTVKTEPTTWGAVKALYRD